MNRIFQKTRATLVLVLLAVVCATAQQPTETAAPPNSGYVLGPDDQIMIRALDAEEISEKPVLIGTDGYIRLPMVGRLHAAGLTVEQLEMEIASGLKPFFQEPQVSVNVVEFRSQPVSVLGAVANSGVVQLRGHKTLVEVISAAGGLKNEAGNSIKITRRKEFGPIPLPTATADPSGQFSVAEVSVKSVMEARNPQENIEVKPNDVISIPRADLIYVIGSLKRAGGFALSEREHISVLQALSMAEGLERVASGKNAKILRSSDGTSTRTEIPVDVNKILAGKANDVPMVANDILFIPNNAAKSASGKAVEAVIQLGTASNLALLTEKSNGQTPATARKQRTRAPQRRGSLSRARRTRWLWLQFARRARIWRPARVLANSSPPQKHPHSDCLPWSPRWCSFHAAADSGLPGPHRARNTGSQRELPQHQAG